jgi:hypothetical protein
MLTGVDSSCSYRRECRRGARRWFVARRRARVVPERGCDAMLGQPEHGGSEGARARVSAVVMGE